MSKRRFQTVSGIQYEALDPVLGDQKLATRPHGDFFSLAVEIINFFFQNYLTLAGAEDELASRGKPKRAQMCGTRPSWTAKRHWTSSSVISS